MIINFAKETKLRKINVDLIGWCLHIYICISKCNEKYKQSSKKISEFWQFSNPKLLD